MADWKQITARIRRARTGKDPVAQLSSLFEKTRDAMVAFELARVFETAGQNSDAAKWYVAAAERFRRADWKTKAQEAAVRLGADLAAANAGDSPADDVAPASALSSELTSTTSESADEAQEEGATVADAAPETSSESSSAQTATPTHPGERKRRRGRRGGRNRRKGGSQPASAAEPAGQRSESASPTGAGYPRSSDEQPEPHTPRTPHRRAIPTLPVEAADFSGPAVRGRSGDPGLSSRLSVLEMQLRRLLNCPPVKLSDAEHAPAGPGVLVLTDSDLSSYYHVEACQTIRVAVGNLLRGGSTRRGGDSIKPQLAEHLGIPETRVGKYLADHCVVRWLQLDEGASHFAHFVISVIRPVLDE